MWTDVSEENIASIFRVKILPSKKPTCSRWQQETVIGGKYRLHLQGKNPPRKKPACNNKQLSEASIASIFRVKIRRARNQRAAAGNKKQLCLISFVKFP
jgi:hypothetical protein